MPATTASVSDVNVALNFTHQYLSDVQIELVNPQGKTVQLFEKGCGDSNGSLSLNYDDLGGAISCNKNTLQTVAPFEPLNLFNEFNPSGTWNLRVRDEFVGDVGTLNSASVTICTKIYTSMTPTTVDFNNVLVYPNPTKGDFGVLFSSKFSSGVTISVHDIVGKKVYEKEFPSAPLFNETIQLNGIQSGIYFLTITDSYNTTVKKVVIY